MILISNISEIYREYTRTQRYPGYIQGIFGLYLESNLNIPKEALGRFTVYSGYIAYIPRICPEDIGGNVRCDRVSLTYLEGTHILAMSGE